MPVVGDESCAVQVTPVGDDWIFLIELDPPDPTVIALVPAVLTAASFGMLPNPVVTDLLVQVSPSSADVMTRGALAAAFCPAATASPVPPATLNHCPAVAGSDVFSVQLSPSAETTTT